MASFLARTILLHSHTPGLVNMITPKAKQLPLVCKSARYKKLRFSRYLRDVTRSLLSHDATPYRGGRSVGTVVEIRVQGYRYP